jgi:GT2 family glycosyltransferase
MGRPLVSIVIPTYKRTDELLRLLRSVKHSTYPLEAIEVIIIDNAQDSQLERLVQEVFENALVITPSNNLHCNAARRLGSQASQGEYIFLIDDDNTLEPECIDALVEAFASNPKLGAVGPIMLDGNSDTIWCAGARVTKFGTARHLWHGHELHRTDLPEMITGVDYFPNACMVSRDALLEVPFDDINFPRGWAEIDFGLRMLAAGFSAASAARAIERHHVGYHGALTRPGPPSKAHEQAKSRILFRKRYLSRISDWLIFWLVVFPASTVVYTLHIMRRSHARLETLAAYFRGTFDGIRQPLASFPNANIERD